MEWTDVDPTGVFQRAIEASLSGVLLVRPEGTVALVNHEAERQFGYARGELIGLPIERLLPETRGAIQSGNRGDLTRAVDSPGDGAKYRLLARRKDGSRFPADLVMTRVQTNGTTLVLANVVDGSGRPETAARAVIEEQLAFERLRSELSAQFINLPIAELDTAIQTGLRRVCEHLGLDHATFYRLTADGKRCEPLGRAVSDAPSHAAAAPEDTMFPWTFERLRGGELTWFANVSEIPSAIDRESYQAAGVSSAVVVPLSIDAKVVGALSIKALRAERMWTSELIHRLRTLARVFEQVLARAQRDDALRAALDEVRRLKEELQQENSILRKARKSPGATAWVGKSPATRRVLEQIHQVAATDSTVLLVGETGTGKEVFATQIHELGTRAHRPLVRVNCAAIPSTLIESELFGREKGAFTGALARQMGRFELAHQATIFLDEIGDLPMDVQVKLLRVLEDGQIERLGSPRSITVDTRIIAATHQDLQRRIAQGAFREDLFYRLNVFPIRVPALRERAEDIPNLTWEFVAEFSKSLGKRIDSICSESLTAMQQYSWPGNIRELRNVVERAMIVATGPRLTIAVPSASSIADRRSQKLVDVEKQHVRSVLEKTHWRIRGVGGAAERLGLKPTTLETRMARLGLKRPEHR